VTGRCRHGSNETLDLLPLLTIARLFLSLPLDPSCCM
jgi:hypothetical protein